MYTFFITCFLQEFTATPYETSDKSNVNMQLYPLTISGYTNTDSMNKNVSQLPPAIQRFYTLQPKPCESVPPQSPPPMITEHSSHDSGLAFDCDDLLGSVEEEREGLTKCTCTGSRC